MMTFFFLIIGKESDGEDLIGEDEGEEYFFLEYLVVWGRFRGWRR